MDAISVEYRTYQLPNVESALDESLLHSGRADPLVEALVAGQDLEKSGGSDLHSR